MFLASEGDGTGEGSGDTASNETALMEELDRLKLGRGGTLRLAKSEFSDLLLTKLGLASATLHSIVSMAEFVSSVDTLR